MHKTTEDPFLKKNPEYKGKLTQMKQLIQETQQQNQCKHFI